MNKIILLGLGVAVSTVARADQTDLYRYYAIPTNAAVSSSPYQSVVYKKEQSGIRPYVSVKANLAIEKTDFSVQDEEGKWPYDLDKNVAGASVAFGLKMGFLRVEAEGNWNAGAHKRTHETYIEEGLVETDEYKWTVRNYSALGNVYVDIPTQTMITPYIGAGAGIAHVRVKNRDMDYDDLPQRWSGNHFAWQVGAGFACELEENVLLDVGYRYMNYGKISKQLGMPDDHALINIKSATHNVYGGFRYMF